jgi:predicted MFS family arabinose efflux permease
MLLWSGQVVSTIGSEITYVAYPLLVLALTHSPAKAGLTGFCVTVPWLLFTLPAGALVDRWDRKRVMIAADAGRALALASVAVALWLDRLTFAQILIAAAIEGTLFVFFFVGERAALRNVVPAEQMTTAMAQNEARFFGASLVGSPIGGALFGLGRSVPFVVDAVSYLASTVGLLLIRKQFQEERTAERRPLHHEIAEGFSWLWRHRFLRTCSLVLSASTPVVFATILSMIVIAEKHGASSGQVGAMLGIAAGGGLAGSFVTPAIVRRLSIRAIVVASPWLQALVLPWLAFLTNPFALGAVLAVEWFFAPCWDSAVVVYRLSVVPDALQARVQSVAGLIAMAGAPIGALAGGFLLESVGGRATILALSGWTLALAIVSTASRSLREGPTGDSHSDSHRDAAGKADGGPKPAV